MPHNFDQCEQATNMPYKNPIGKNSEPHFLQVDRRIAETISEIEYMTKMLESKKQYLKQLNAVRKQVTPEDEAKIQALISVGLL